MLHGKSTTQGAEDRLAHLERDRRQIRWIGGGMIVVLAAWMGVNSPRSHHVVKAERWELRDQAGALRALMTADDGGTPRLSFFDEEGRDLLQIKAYSHAPEVSFSTRGRPRLLLSGADSGGVVQLFPSEDAGRSLILSPPMGAGPSDGLEVHPDDPEGAAQTLAPGGVEGLREVGVIRTLESNKAGMPE